MDLPKYQAFYKPILLFLQDGKAHSTKEIKQYTQKYFSLKEEDNIETYHGLTTSKLLQLRCFQSG